MTQTTECSTPNCNNPVHKDDKCILHCEKNYDLTKKELKQFEIEFFNYFIFSIHCTFKSFENIHSGISMDYLKAQFDPSKGTNWDNYEYTLRRSNKKIEIVNINFPNISENFDYTFNTRKFKEIHFKDCHFYEENINLTSSQFYTFNSCHFHCKFNMNSQISHTSTDKIKYSNCTFYEELIFKSKSSLNRDVASNQIRNHSLFSDCIFYKKITFSDILIDFNIFENTSVYTAKADIHITKCLIAKSQNFNNFRNLKLKLNDCKIDSDLHLYNNDNCEFKADICDFNKKLLFHDCTFNNFHLVANTHQGSATFYNCIFSSTFMPANNHFLSYTSFTKCDFNKGIDLRHSSFTSLPSFLTISVNNKKQDSKKVDRDTYRIIKHSLDSSGDKVEANKYFAKEMNAYTRETLSGWKKISNWPKILILLFNRLLSNFGQCYLLPIFLLFCSVGFYNWLTKLFKKGSMEFLQTTKLNWLCELSGNILGFLPKTGKVPYGFEFVALLFHMLFAALIYQTIIALKRQTRR